MAPVDAQRLRRAVITYAIVAMAAISLAVAATAIVPLATKLRDGVHAGLQHELALKVLAGGQVLGRARSLAEQVTSRTVIRERLEMYNRGAVALAALTEFTRDKLADALSLSPEPGGGHPLCRLGRGGGGRGRLCRGRSHARAARRQRQRRAGPAPPERAPLPGGGGAHPQPRRQRRRHRRGGGRRHRLAGHRRRCRFHGPDRLGGAGGSGRTAASADGVGPRILAASRR
ncbi:MAG: hypothetical protein NVV74_06525 [Magnetospirillum sp.]|nr:hypothetical protein [Magnetospirillum sp.]